MAKQRSKRQERRQRALERKLGDLAYYEAIKRDATKLLQEIAALEKRLGFSRVAAVLFVALGAAPAFAQEAAPSVQAENWVQALLGLVVTGILLPLARELFGLVKAKAEGTRFSGAVNRVSELVESKVAWVHAKLQEAASDGKVTQEEWQTIANELLDQLPSEALGILRAQLGSGVAEWVAGRLMVRFTAQARAVEAAAAAAATVPNVDAAKAHPLWKEP